jgi:GNAT superfamily N-acetyltransferase
MEVFQAGLEHLGEISTLFNQYRIFYQSPSDLGAAQKFLQARFEREESILFVARSDDRLVGFTQLYPSFSSVAMQRIWILNDLFVEADWRGRGVAKRLMGAAENFARATGAIRIVLATQVENVAAQKLYESCGYAKDDAFYHYVLYLQA